MNDREEIALVIADQWMPEMTGSEFLTRVRSLEPSAKRALLVAWGDHEASPTTFRDARWVSSQLLIQAVDARGGSLISIDKRILSGVDASPSARYGADQHRRR